MRSFNLPSSQPHLRRMLAEREPTQILRQALKRLEHISTTTSSVSNAHFEAFEPGRSFVILPLEAVKGYNFHFFFWESRKKKNNNLESV